MGACAAKQSGNGEAERERPDFRGEAERERFPRGSRARLFFGIEGLDFTLTQRRQRFHTHPYEPKRLVKSNAGDGKICHIRVSKRKA
jgi:hypothetical protein